MDEHIERRFLPFPEDRLAGFVVGAAGKYAAKKIGTALGQKYGAQAVGLISKHPTGAAVVNTLDEAGVFKKLGIKTGPSLKEKIAAKLDEDIDLGGGVKINTATLAGLNLGVALQPDLDPDPRPLGGPLMPYGNRAQDARALKRRLSRGPLATWARWT